MGNTVWSMEKLAGDLLLELAFVKLYNFSNTIQVFSLR